jgi:sortase A
MKYLCRLVTVSSFVILALGLWIPFKALVAQELLELAWAESQARQKQVRPWPWADTWPVARLDFQYDHTRQSLIVLDGAHGESLAFGPGQVFGNDRNTGPRVIAGHRDTHFSRLKHLKAGSELKLQSRDGHWQTYQVTDTRVVDSRHQQINTDTLAPDSLILVTCYPFNGLQANGPLRYVVEAKATPSDLLAAVVER